MICRVIRAYGPYSVGHVFTDMPGNVARTLIARHLVEEVTDEKLIRSPADRMLRSEVTKQTRRKTGAQEMNGDG
jgi:hypothetical protein